MPNTTLADMEAAGGLARGVYLFEAGYRGNALYQGLSRLFPGALSRSVRALGRRVFAAIRAATTFLGGKQLQVSDLPLDRAAGWNTNLDYGEGRLTATVRYNFRDQISHRRFYRTTHVNADDFASLRQRLAELPRYLANRQIMGLSRSGRDKLPRPESIKLDVISIVRKR
jgi:hypothetical protein